MKRNNKNKRCAERAISRQSMRVFETFNEHIYQNVGKAVVRMIRINMLMHEHLDDIEMPESTERES